MADTAQIIYEHTSESGTLSFFTEDLTVTIHRHFLRIEARPDNTLMVIDPTVIQREFSCTAKLTGDNWKKLHDWLIAAITYTDAYPRLTTVNWDNDDSITNTEVAITSCSARDIGNGYWNVAVTFMEKDR